MKIGKYAQQQLITGCGTNFDLQPLTQYSITRDMIDDPCIEKLHYRNCTVHYEVGSALEPTLYEINQYVTSQKNVVSRAKIMSAISWHGTDDLLSLLRNSTTVNEIYFPVWNNIINESILDEHKECKNKSLDELLEIMEIM